MKTRSSAAHGRRWGIPAALLAALCAAQPAIAAGCSPNGYQVSPKNQNNILEFDAANNYNRNLVHLGISKALDAGAVPTWSQLSGPAVTLDTSNPLSPTFLTPDVPAAGATLTFRLTVTCPDGGNGANEGTVSIINVNRPPVAYASSAPPIAYYGDAVVLHGYAPAGSPVSNDPDGDSLTYSWVRTAGPAVTLANAASATASFTAPAAGSPYTLQFQLTVRDRPTGGLTSTAAVVVNVSQYLPPIARLVCPEHVSELGQVLLDGSTSSDPNGGVLTYQWTQLQGSPAIAIGGETGSTAQFNAPKLTAGQDGLLEFQLKATDSRGLFDLATCMTQIDDVTAPLLSMPADIDTEATSAAGAMVDYDAAAQDAVDDAAPYVPACVPPPGSTFALAAAPVPFKTTAVSCTATDTSGNTASAGFNVTVRDSTPPTISVPGSLGVEATSASGASASFDAPTSDVVDGIGSATCAPASGATFPLGTTSVTCNATDARGNAAAPASFNLTVHDTTQPVVTAPASTTFEATTSLTPLTAADYGNATATDAVGVVSITNDAPATFPVGTTTITWTAADAAGNTGTATSTVTLQDLTAPVVTPPADTAFEAIATLTPLSAADYGNASATDAVGVVSLTNDAPANFPVGVTTITWTATDLAGNAGTATSTVTVRDTVAPAVTPPASSDFEATAPLTMLTTADYGNATATDGVGVVSLTSDAPLLFPVGITTITWTASDLAGNAGSAISTVTVHDTTAPVVTAPGNVTVEATAPLTPLTSADYGDASATDAVGVVSLTNDAPAGFPVGTTTVTWTASDFAGNTGTATSTVTVQDTTAPVVTAPSNTVFEATGPSTPLGVADYGNASALDAVGVVSLTSDAPASFPVGVTTITWSASDLAGNVGTATNTVTVRDTTPPVVTAPANAVFEATAPLTALGAADYGNASALDAVGVVSLVNDAPASFPVGITTITWSASDQAGNIGTATSTVTVRDTTAPVVTAPANTVFEATAPLTPLDAADYGSASALDAVGVHSLSNDAPASFPVGTTTIIWSAADAAGNVGSATSTVTVRDTTAPVVTAPADTTFEATGTSTPLAASDYGNASALDAVGVDSLTNDAPVSFPLGTTTITWTARDAAGNSGSATSTVTVRDTTAPAVAAPADSTFEATAPLTPLTAADYGNATATDAVGVDSLTNNAPASFPLGATSIVWTAVDAAGNSGTATSTVTVLDRTPPTIAPHGNMVAEATGPGGASVGYVRPATSDLVDGPAIATCAPASGHTFSLGTHTVTCNAADGAGNAATPTSFSVTVQDTTKPVIGSHGDEVREATGPGGASVSYTAPATFDAVDVALGATCVPASGTTFALGTHTVTCNASDASGNAATATTFTVTVRDTTAPAITPHADVSATATSNSSAPVAYTDPTAQDLVDGARPVGCVPASGSSFPVGATTVTCSASDTRGNSATRSFKVNVGYNFNGFFQPVDNAVVNTVKAGSAIPVKFSLGGNQGLAIFASNSPASVATAQCDGAASDEVEVTVTAGNSSLSYDPGANQYNYVWKTEKNWVGCRQLRMTFKDGTVRTAMFKFR